MPDIDIMDGIVEYNEVDCRVMEEVLSWWRENR